MSSANSSTTSGASRAPDGTDAAFMKQSQVPLLVEQVLGAFVPTRHPRPFEFVSQLCLPTPAPRGWSRPAAVVTLEDAAATEEGLDTLEFDIFTLDADGPEEVAMAVSIFERYPDVLRTCELSLADVQTWAFAVQRNYRPIPPVTAAADQARAATADEAVQRRRDLDGDDVVPFHNFRHALNVLQTLHVFLTRFEAKQHFDAIEVLALLVSALSHDLQHPGRDSKFLSATGHPLATRYNDVAVLEQHHCAMAFAVLDADGCDLCKAFRHERTEGISMGLLSPEYRHFRDCVVKCILSTEVASHRKHVDALAHVVDSGNFDPKGNGDHRKSFMACLVEAADVSNEIRSFALSKRWAAVVEAEFCRQGDVERKLGLSVPVMRDRVAVDRAKEQVGFINFLCFHLYETLAKAVPAMSVCIENLQRNRSEWQRQVRRE